jgi:hypothetical protein
MELAQGTGANIDPTERAMVRQRNHIEAPETTPPTQNATRRPGRPVTNTDPASQARGKVTSHIESALMTIGDRVSPAPRIADP